MNSRTKKAKLNIATSMIVQGVTMISGLILPQLLIRAYGSAVYGLTTSITHFLAYISLLEGGISGVARAALYKPLADRDSDKINSVYFEIVRFFRVIAIIFILYTMALAVGYKYIARNSNFEWIFTFVLVLVMSISTLAQYFFGISNSILLQAEQKHYINNILSISTLLLNTCLVIVLVKLGCDIILVKLISGCVYLLKPLALMFYVKKKYSICKTNAVSSEKKLSQKWTALGQHIAYFLHTNTDVVVLTIFTNLETVAVYSIYNMIVSNVRNLVSSFSNGLESIFGNMYAKNETERLQKTFGYYETLLSIVMIVLLSVTCILIVPFVKIYTAGMNDADYIQPLFAIIFVMAEMVYCIRIPYHYMINAANHFRQTKFGAYGEVAINIIGSLLLVQKFGITGVALATLLAMIFRTVYYSWYLSKNILFRSIVLFIKRQSTNVLSFGFIIGVGIWSSRLIEMTNYLSWAAYACALTAVSFAVVFLVNYILFREDVKAILARLFRKV